MATVNITAKDKFNALQNAQHIFAFKEEGIAFRPLEMLRSEDSAKVIIQREDGTIDALFTDARSAIESLAEVIAVFGVENVPLIKVNTRDTKKGATVYYVEVQ